MKYIVALGILFGTFACKKVDEFTKFDMDYDEEFTIPSSVGVNLPFNVISPDIESNSETTFEINDTRKDLIEQIILKSLKLTITSPTNGDFSFLDEIHLFLSADGLAEVEVGWKTNIPNTIGNVIELEMSGSDLQEYIKKDQFNIRLNTITDEIITADHKILMNSVFFVDAKVLGQ